VRSVAALVAIPVLVLTALLGLVFIPVTGTADAATPTQTAATADGPLQLDLLGMTPRVVTSTGPGTLTITGTLTNTGTTPVDDVVVRLQRSDPLTTEGELRDALDGSAATDAVTPQFTPLADTLGPGQQVPVQLAVPLRGQPTSSLALSSTGVHELLVNVNGAPRGGARARLAAVRLLLPVLSLPPVDSTAPVTPDPPATPAPFSLLYPIADVPHRLSTVPGGRALLTDDSLAASFAPGGRLGGLVEALAQQAPVGSRVRSATCVAVDPDLVETAAAMRDGYDVRRADGSIVPGTGEGVAGQWLAQLTAAVRGGCVVALPYADADLVALTRGGLASMAASAVTGGRQSVSTLLGTPVVPDVTWPAGGVVDEPTLDMIAGTGTRSLLLSADGIDAGRSRPSTGVVPISGTSRFAVLTDPLLAAAAGGPADSAATARTDGAAVTSTPAASDTSLSTQDAIGALAFRAQDGLVQNATTGKAAPLVLAPPHRWAADGVGATALLQAAEQLMGAGEITADPLPAVLAAGPPAGAPARPAVYPLTSGATEIPRSVVDTIGRTAESVADLRSAVVPGSGVGIGADEVFAPLVAGLVRPASATFRGDPAAAAAAAAAGAGRIDDVRSTVRVLEPPSPYSLGTSDAPLPLTVANGLPLTVQVRIQIASTTGLRVAPIAPVQIPPLGRRQVSVNAQVTRSGQFMVDATVLTPDGGVLGPPSRLKVRSTVYGTITVWLTVGAGVLLVVLVARRMVRRIRGTRGRHSGPEARTDPTPPPRRPSAGPAPPTVAAPAGPHSGDPPTRPVEVLAPSPRPVHPAHGPRARVPQEGGPVPAAPVHGRAPLVPAQEDVSATDRFPAHPPRPTDPPNPQP
jgi:hypothetical protein